MIEVGPTRAPVTWAEDLSEHEALGDPLDAPPRPRPSSSRTLAKQESLNSYDSDGLPNIEKLWQGASCAPSASPKELKKASGSSCAPSATPKGLKKASPEYEKTLYYEPVAPTKRIVKAIRAKNLKRPAAAGTDNSDKEELDDESSQESEESEAIVKAMKKAMKKAIKPSMKKAMKHSKKAMKVAAKFTPAVSEKGVKQAMKAAKKVSERAHALKTATKASKETKPPGQVLGCSKCRMSASGCARCKALVAASLA